jgi:dimethylhistidine N-methyltransferase
MPSFAEDVRKGLTSTPKRLSSKYFYDETGSRLFQQIMNMESYYLTDAELEILQMHEKSFLKYFLAENPSFDLIELGAGDGKKTRVLLELLQRDNTDFRYLPVDISEEILLEMAAQLKEEIPGLKVIPQPGDYFQVLEHLEPRDHASKVILFLGSNIGNFVQDRAIKFLHHVGDYMDPGDLLLIGCDLKKDPGVILPAYNDPEGVTAAFNKNLLTRINRELDAGFDENKFLFYPFYNIETGEVRSYLISKEEQEVEVKGIGERIHFDQWEYIHTEISKKYDLKEIEELATRSGFSVVENFFDSRKYFVSSLWKKVETTPVGVAQ